VSQPPIGRSDPESVRLQEDARREVNWKRWGPYLSERQWGTVREDYSPDAQAWDYLPHDHARSRAYRWGEDGLLGICDREGRLCFALALWNGRDPILKERLFGLNGEEGNHGEDVKEQYFFLDATPTHTYLKALYKYPQAEYPYGALVAENRRRGRGEPEYELGDTGVLASDDYYDIQVEYAKAGPEDILIRITVANRGAEPAVLHLLPTLWFRNTWSWGRAGEGYPLKPPLQAVGASTIGAIHPTLGRYRLEAGPDPGGRTPELLFTENETNVARLFGGTNPTPYVKDAFHEHVVRGQPETVNPARTGTKAAAWYRLAIPALDQAVVRLRLSADSAVRAEPFGPEFDGSIEERRREADLFYEGVIPAGLTEEQRRVSRQAYAGLIWSKQFYNYVVKEWLEGDTTQPRPSPGRKSGRNSEWPHLYNRDVISMPDTWEYPWYAAWDLAFHMLPFARVDLEFAKAQLVLFLREWYMHPNGQIPAYEWALGDVNPPVHAWASWRVYKMSGPRGSRDRMFLERVFQKLLLNFTWWVNRKDVGGRNLFGGGFLGLDNVGVFDRSRPLPNGRFLAQADGTSWMAFFCGTMLSMALELAHGDPVYEDIASKFFEHFVAIVDAMNGIGGTGLWNEDDGFYYDQVLVDDRAVPVRLRSLVGLIPLLACEVLEREVMEALPGFSKRMQWFLRNRSDLTGSIAYLEGGPGNGHGHRLLAVPSRERLVRVLGYMLDEGEFLSPFGIRSLSKRYAGQAYKFSLDGSAYEVGYEPGESLTALFGGNSNWRGPVWFPVNYLLVEALERYHHFYGDALQVECPTGSGKMFTLKQVAAEITRRLVSLFLPGPDGHRPCHGAAARFAEDPHWRDLVLFYEYFHGDTGRGCGASHQTGWTALVARSLEALAAGQSSGRP
jgi:hypothetical protein